jgi:NAD+ synthase
MNLEIEFNEEHLQIIKQFIIAKVADARSNGVVFGVSGGLDSAVVFYICHQIFESHQITPVFLPETTTPTQDSIDAKLISSNLEIPLVEINIDPIMDVFLNSTNLDKMDPNSLGNLKARVRMNILYLIANSENKLVLGTSNKSELLLGYYTKFGDGGSDVAPIGDLYKTQVKGLAQHLGVPDNIISKPPTAGLIADQTDEDELGLSYEIIDKILYGLECDVTSNKIAQALDLEIIIIEDIKQKVKVNRHKRKFSKIPKLGLKTIGVDLYE